MIASSLTIDRTSLGLDPLVLTNNPFDESPFTFPEDGLSEPNFEMRRSYAPDSAHIPGHLLLGAVMDGTTLPLIVAVTGESLAEMVANKVTLTEALAQLSYTVTIEIDDVAIGTYPADATLPWWGVLDHGDLSARIAVATVSIPVNPSIPTEET